MLKKVISFLVIISIAVVIAAGMRQMKPTPQQHIKEKTIATVAVIPIKIATLSSQIISHGTVVAQQHSEISSEVGGKIMSTTDKLAQGHFVKKGDLLLSIDKTDYEADVATARSFLLEKQITLKDKKSSYSHTSLAVQQAQAAQFAAEQQLKKSQRDLRNTDVRAAFNGIVQNKRVDKGQFIGKGQHLFDLLGTDTAEVFLPINRKDIQHLDNSAFQKTIQTAITLTSVIGTQRQKIVRSLTQARLQGAIDSQTRVFYLTVEIPDPYNFKAINKNKKPLPIGSFVNASIHTQSIEHAVRLPLELIQQDSSVYLYVDGYIQQQSVQILRKEDHHAIINKGLHDGDLLVTTELAMIYDGMPVQLSQKTDNQFQQTPLPAVEIQHAN